MESIGVIDVIKNNIGRQSRGDSESLLEKAPG